MKTKRLFPPTRSLTWLDRSDAADRRMNSRYKLELAERMYQAMGTMRDMDRRRHNFGARDGAYVFMFTRGFRHNPYKEKIWST